MKIEPVESCEYGQHVATVLSALLSVASSTEAVLTAIVDILIGSGQTRLGPRPSPEAHVAMRAIVRDAQEAGRPVPVLVPFGPVKPEGGEPDLAELWALSRLACVSRRVRQIYEPGLEVRVRLEDATGHYLEPARIDEIAQYTGRFVGLVEILSEEEGISVTGVPESDLVNPLAFVAEACLVHPVVSRYLDGTTGDEPLEATAVGRELRDAGWRGAITSTLRAAMTERMEKIVGAANAAAQIRRYFSAALARRRLGVARAGWVEPVIEYSFHPPTGAPFHAAAPGVYARTVDARVTKRHVAPWRACGYLSINGETRGQLVPWRDRPEGLEPNHVRVVGSRQSVLVRADYLLED